MPGKLIAASWQELSKRYDAGGAQVMALCGVDLDLLGVALAGLAVSAISLRSVTALKPAIVFSSRRGRFLTVALCQPVAPNRVRSIRY